MQHKITLQGKEEQHSMKVLPFKCTFHSACLIHTFPLIQHWKKELITYNMKWIVLNATTYILSIPVSMNHFPADEKTEFYKFLNAPPLG